MAVDDHHLAGALDHRGVGGHQPDRAAAVDHHGLSRLDARHLRRVPAGREDVGDHDVVRLLLLGVLGEAQRVEVGPRDAQVLGLAALVRPHVREAVRGARHVLHRLGLDAVVRQPAVAVHALAARDVEGQADPVADLQALDVLADLGHLPEVLMPECAARLEAGPPLVHVEVRATDVGRGDPDEHIGRALDPRIVDLSDGHVARSVVDDCFHIPPPGNRWSLPAP